MKMGNWFEDIIESIDNFFHSGHVVANATDKIVQIADNVAKNIDTTSNHLNDLIDATTKDTRAFVDEVPKIAANVNTSIVEFNQVLHGMYVAIIFSMVLCFLCCIFYTWASCKNVYGIKKIKIIKSPSSSKIDNDIEKEPIVASNEQNQNDSSKLDVTIDIPSNNDDAGSLNS